MTVQQIFSLFFTDDSDYYVSMESFKRSMVKLAMKFGGQIDFNELTKIAQHFDINNDGRVSKVEFKLYCLNIPSIAWKAAKKRMESVGGVNELRKLSEKMRPAARSRTEEATSRLKIKRRRSLMIEAPSESDYIPCGPEVFRSTKLYWKTNTSVDVRLFYCEPLDIMTMQMFENSEGKKEDVHVDIPNIYVFRSACEVDRVVKSAEFEESLEGAFLREGVRNKEEASVVRETAVWEVVGRYLLARLEVIIPSCYKI
mmetsp:Transcript_24963/g.57679  ORF Transcript_24963/g.57679 Transcript_24963/m.57679 type:complete len:256 (+) Transcript_24963:4298-5065(+)